MLEFILDIPPWHHEYRFRGPFVDRLGDIVVFRVHLIFNVIQWPLPPPQMRFGLEFNPNQGREQAAVEGTNRGNGA